MSEIKPLLRQMIDNNEPYWRTRTIRGAHNLLDEYEAKAKAFDETIEILKELRDFSKKTEPHSQRMKVKRRNYVQFCDEVLREIELSYKEITNEYEGGEPFVKK